MNCSRISLHVGRRPLVAYRILPVMIHAENAWEGKPSLELAAKSIDARTKHWKNEAGRSDKKVRTSRTPRVNRAVDG